MDPAVLRELCRQSVLAMGRTWPNPAVACVIQTADGMFAGGTEPPGGRHAEIVALDSLDDFLRKHAAGPDGPGKPGHAPSASAREGVLYVTLEPCSKFGRTPPCTNRILQYPGLRVLFLAYDPTLSGEGERILREAGMSVLYHDHPMARAFLAGFVSRVQSAGPRLHLKVAHAGRVVGRRQGRLMVSGADGLAFGQLLRSRLDGAATGPGTAALDRPRLDLRPFSAPYFIRQEGEDLLVDSWLDFASEIRLQTDPATARSGEKHHEGAFQPARVFIVRERFDGSDEWLLVQQEITRSTGRPFYLLSDRPELWPGALEILPPRSPGFVAAFKEKLAGLGLNEVLVECGPGLFAALREGLSVSDRLYFIESKDSLDGDVLLPEDFDRWPAGLSVKAVYESEKDILRVIA
jgi:pyrimidine deaminase RibD-like protein/riboflavin biosynthesis pyrimidine reductase